MLGVNEKLCRLQPCTWRERRFLVSFSFLLAFQLLATAFPAAGAAAASGFAAAGFSSLAGAAAGFGIMLSPLP
jgi:hypothetical protein